MYEPEIGKLLILVNLNHEFKSTPHLLKSDSFASFTASQSPTGHHRHIFYGKHLDLEKEIRNWVSDMVVFCNAVVYFLSQRLLVQQLLDSDALAILACMQFYVHENGKCKIYAVTRKYICMCFHVDSFPLSVHHSM